MTLARIVAASVFALGVLTLITIRLVATRAERRRIAREAALAAGIADERRGPWLFAEDETPDEDQLTEVLAVDPPVVPSYVDPATGKPGWYLLDGDQVVGFSPADALQPHTTMPPVIVTPPPAPEWTSVGEYRVHVACAEKHERRQKVTDGCAEFLVHSGGTS